MICMGRPPVEVALLCEAQDRRKGTRGILSCILSQPLPVFRRAKESTGIVLPCRWPSNTLGILNAEHQIILGNTRGSPFHRCTVCV